MMRMESILVKYGEKFSEKYEKSIRKLSLCRNGPSNSVFIISASFSFISEGEYSSVVKPAALLCPPPPKATEIFETSTMVSDLNDTLVFPLTTSEISTPVSTPETVLGRAESPLMVSRVILFLTQKSLSKEQIQSLPSEKNSIFAIRSAETLWVS